jgi:hypothetical protein
MKTFFVAVLSLCFIAGSAFAACDMEALMTEFSAILRKTAGEDPEKMSRVQPDMNRLAAELEAIMDAARPDSGMDDALCAKVEELIAVFHGKEE